MKTSSVSDGMKKAEIKIVSVLVEHNVPFHVMDHLSDVIKDAFPDSEIARKFSCKRTKSSAIAYNVLGGHFEEKLIQDLKSGLSTFSVIIDESTDVSTKKVLAIAIKFYSERNACVKTRFLCTVDIQGESALDLFNALNSALEEKGLNMKNQLLGFAADTTNVMFGDNNGIVAKIREINPNCIFVKCVCHSVALAVSHACKVLPRSLEQLVKDVYNYFSQSSKRQREFQEFQEFTASEKHKILRHYDIRWLSLHNCVNRILEQWIPLKLFFQGQYLTDKQQNVSCEFLYNSFNDNLILLYFYFLDFVLPIVNKFNIIFQGDYPVTHTFFKDMSSFFRSILSCFMKSTYVKATNLSDLDPDASMHYLPLNEMYLGVNVAKNLYKIQGNQTIVHDFFKRCQLFFINLSNQLKSRLPLDKELFKELQFLDPQVVVYQEFSSLINLLSKFPNIVPEEVIQDIDNEYREMKLDLDVSNLLSSGSSNINNSFNVEEFWHKISCLKDNNNKLKYENISKFAKQMLSLPVSNVKCERIFSEFNRIKTDDRNKFHNKNVSALIHAKEGLRDVGSCPNFQPDVRMIKLMDDKTLYKNLKYKDDEI